MATCDDDIDPKSGFCASKGVFYSKRSVVPLPSDSSLTLPAFLLQQHSSVDGLRPAYIDFQTGTSISYAQLHTQIRAAAAGLAQFGLRKGDVLLLLSPNSAQFSITLQAAMSIGAVVTTCNPLNLPIEIAKQASESGTKFVATTAGLARKTADLHLPLILLGGEEGEQAYTDSPHPWPHPRCITFSRLISADTKSFPQVQTHQEDIALLLYSSGTTGTSKGVMISHKSLIAQAVFFMTRSEGMSWSSRIYLCIIPMFHAFGLATFCSAVLTRGCPIVILPKFGMVQMLSAIQKYKVTHVPLVPPILLALAKSSLVENYDLSSLFQVSVGAAPVSKELTTTFKARFANVSVLQGYGLTESTAVGANTSGVEDQDNSTGLIAPNTEAKIVDIDSGKPLPPNHQGELWLRGPSIMHGYLGRPEETRSAVDHEGWLHTGDLGYIDTNGHLFIIDRLKELIKYKGFQVAPAELEAVLLSHPHIVEAAVVPCPDEKAGQIPIAYVVRVQGTVITEMEVINFVAQRVAPFKKVRRVEFVSSIPKTPSGKILRRQLVIKAASKL